MRDRLRHRRKLQQKKEDAKFFGGIGIFSGMMTTAKAAGNACMGIAASPLLKAVGLAIIMASVGYMFWTWIS